MGNQDANEASDEFLDAHTKAESLKYTAPGLALSHTIADVNANGSPRAKRQARILIGLLIAAAVIPSVLLMISRLFS